MIPRAFIDDVLNRIDIVEFIDSYVPLKKRGTSYIACCPFHTEKTPSFNVIAKKQFYHCFGCGASGNVISFAMNYLHQGFTDAIETLATRLGLPVPQEGQTEKTKVSQDFYQFLNQVARLYQHTLKTDGNAAINYLKQRHINGEVARLYQLGYAPPGWHTLETHFPKQQTELIATGMLVSTDDGKIYDRYRQRIMFPIHDRHGRIIGFGGRAIDASQKPKYLNSPETVIFQKSRELYGLHQVLQHNKTISEIIVVEGYIDVIALAQHGITNAVATLGTATSAYHIQLLNKYTQRLIFCFDGDAAGRQAAWRALESSLPYLNTGLDANFVFLPDNHDPDSLVREEGKDPFLQRLKNAIPLHRFFIDTLTRNIDINRLAQKTQLINTAKPYLLKITNGPYQQLLIDELARLTRMESHRIHQLIIEPSLENENSLQKKEPITRSPVRIAIALLLQHPEIYTTCQSQLANITLEPEHVILTRLMQQINDNPNLTTAHFIELWRESPLFEALTKLAAWDHQVPEHALQREFLDTILFLSKQNKEHAIQQLMQKAHNEGLTETERVQLQNLLKERHQKNSS